MHQVLVYSDSLSWGIIPDTRLRLSFEQRWSGVMEHALNATSINARVIEDCLNGRRTVLDDPFKPGRNGLTGLAQRIEIHSPLSLVILMLGNNDFQSMHDFNAWHSSQGIATLVMAIRNAPLEPGMPVPPIMVVAPPSIRTPKGVIATKFAGGEHKCAGLAACYQAVSSSLDCYFFDAGTVVCTSEIDGIHLDADQHLILGNALAQQVSAILA